MRETSPVWLRKLNSTVFPQVLPAVAFFTLVGFIPPIVRATTGFVIVVNTVMLTVLGTILAFALSLRTSTANDRYQEGRRAWSLITMGSRQLSMLVWLHLPPTTLSASEVAGLAAEERDEQLVRALIEKRTVVNVIQALSVALKHYLRDESGPYYEDLFPLVKALPRYLFPSSVTTDEHVNVLGLWRTHGDSVLIPAEPRSTASPGTSTLDIEKGLREPQKMTLLPGEIPPPWTIYNYIPIFYVFKPLFKLLHPHRDQMKRELRRRRKEAESNIPLEINLFLSGYVAEVIRRGTTPVPVVAPFFAALGMLQEAIPSELQLTNGVKLATNATSFQLSPSLSPSAPLPFSYNSHLKFSVFAYLLFLPFQIGSLLNWGTPAAVALVSSIFLGFLSLGDQLEDPFGYDDSDLPLEHYCRLIAEELRSIVAHRPPTPSDYVFSSLNTPFGSDPRTASELLRDFLDPNLPGVPGERRVREMLAHHPRAGARIGQERAQEEKDAGKGSWRSRKSATRRGTETSTVDVIPVLLGDD